MSVRWLVCLPILAMGISPASAEEALSLGDVIERARTRAPATRIARARTEEAGAALVGARRLSTRNPVIEADVGPRWSDGRSTDAHVAVSIPLDLGRRSKRISAAEADIRREGLEAKDVERQTVGLAVTAYYKLLHADRLLALAEERQRLAEAAQTTAQQRSRAGDVAQFDVNLARAEVARARSGIASAKSDQLRARTELAAILGLPPGASITVAGELADRSPFDRQDGDAPMRFDLRALRQEISVARAEEALALAERWPSLDLRVSAEHEHDADVLLGGIAIALPLFERGQGEAAKARARARRAQLELETRTEQVTTQLSHGREAYASALAAVEILERDAIPLSNANEAASATSYRAGKIELGTMLMIRREALDTRREHLDRLLDAALAAVDLWVARGGGPIR